MLAVGKPFVVGAWWMQRNGAAFTGSEIQKRIMQVHNFDGPGFTKDIIDQMSQGEISERIRTIVPQSSVIGMLLEHEESYEVVASTQLGIFQHDMFSWQLQRNAFVKVDDISAFIDRMNSRSV